MSGIGNDKKRVAIIGYGSQGRAVALNLRDSGYRVTIGLRSGSKSRQKAKGEGFADVTTISRATASSKIICFAFPDNLHGKIFESEIGQNLSSGSTLWFLHGLSVHFKLLQPPENIDVILVAPHAPGPAVREKYLSDRSLSAFVAVDQDISGQSETKATALARGIGIRKNRLFRTTFAHEAIGDIFGEQAVLCGGLAMLIKSGFETLVENGHNADHAYLEVAYQLDLIVQLIRRHGISGMFDRISTAARLGSLNSGPKIIDSSVRQRMRQLYDEISSGQFARELSDLSEKETAALKNQLKSLSHPSLERAAKKFAN